MERNADAFDRFAEDWDAQHGPDSPRRDEFAARIRLLRRLCAGGRVLELGCGTGMNLIALSDVVAEGVGIDFSPVMIDKARANAGRAGAGNLSFAVSDALAAAREGVPFDTVLLAGVLEHLPDPPAVLDACRRRLARKGRIIVVMPHPFGLAPVWRRLSRGERFRLFAEDRHYSPFALARMGARAGLVPVGLHALPCLPAVDGEEALPSWLAGLSAGLARLPVPMARGAYALVLRSWPGRTRRAAM